MDTKSQNDSVFCIYVDKGLMLSLNDHDEFGITLSSRLHMSFF